MSNNPVAESLKQVLADTYALYTKTQNVHWNVTGPMFKSVHDLTELQYNDLFTAIDEIAERIRALGEKAPGTMKYYSDKSSIQPTDENASAETMIADLVVGNRQMAKSLKAAIEVADDADDNVSEDMLIGRLTIHEKNAWMLAALLGDEQVAKLTEVA